MRRLVWVVLVVVLASCAWGCKKKVAAQVTPPPPPPPVEVTAERAPEPPPPPAPPETPDPLDGDLDSVDRWVRDQGLVGTAYFDYDRSELRSDALDRLQRNARFMLEHERFHFTIEGHCDERGTIDYNLALGQRRASAARDYLVSRGVSAQRLRTVSYGEDRPACTQSTESCWGQNRRAEFVVSGSD